MVALRVVVGDVVMSILLSCILTLRRKVDVQRKVVKP